LHLGLRERYRRPELGGLTELAAKLESRRRNAYDGVAFSIQHDRSADDTRVGAKAASPETIADHHHVLTALLILVRRKDSPHSRADAECWEKARCDAECPEPFRFATLGKVCGPAGKGGHVFE